MKTEWVLLAEAGDGALAIARGGFSTSGEAAAVRREIEGRMAHDDETNYLILTRASAERAVRASREGRRSA